MQFFCFYAPGVFSDDTVTHHSKDFIFGGTDKILVRSLIGGAETVLVNGLVLGFNAVAGVSWAIPNAKTIQNNFTERWVWELIDGFKVNNLGHPLQGAMYFAAGRVNGFGFYESLLFNAFGSFTWESLFETNAASMNDFVVTVAASLSTGEILYRLYLEALAAGIPVPIAIFINPMAGFHQLVTGWKPPNYGEKAIYDFQIHTGVGFTHAYYSMADNVKNTFFSGDYFIDLGFDIIYGNPFEQDTFIPYKHFELSCSFDWSFVNYTDIRIISDGYIFSFSPIYSEKNMMSSGLSLHLDFFNKGDPDMETPSSIELFSNALDWTIKYQHLFSDKNKFEFKYHLGASFMGASRFYNTNIMMKLHYFGAGFNTKLYLRLINAKAGSLETSVFAYTLWNFPGIQPMTALAVDKGVIFWLFNDTTYFYPVSEHISLGISLSVVYEWKYFNNFPNSMESNQALKIFIAWNI